MSFAPEMVDKIEIENTQLGKISLPVEFIRAGGYNSVYSAKCTDPAWCAAFGIPMVKSKDDNGNPIMAGEMAIRIATQATTPPSLTIGPPPPEGTCHAQSAGAATVYDQGIATGGLEVGIMKKYDGNLRDFISDNGPLNERQTADLLATIALAKDAIAQSNNIAGVVHSDIKPENILFKKTGGVLEFAITDFDTIGAVGKPWKMAGTAGYMHGRELVKSMDLGGGSTFVAHEGLDAFSIGATLHEARTGVRHSQIPTKNTNTTPLVKSIAEIADIDGGTRMVQSTRAVLSDKKIGNLNWTELAMSHLMLSDNPKNDDIIALSYFRCSDAMRAKFTPDQHVKIHHFITAQAKQGNEFYEALYAQATKFDQTIDQKISPAIIKHNQVINNRIATSGFTKSETEAMNRVSDRYINTTAETAKKIADHAAPLPQGMAYKIREGVAKFRGTKTPEQQKNDDIAKGVGIKTTNLGKNFQR